MIPTDNELYWQIKPLPSKGDSFMHYPGVYCQTCGEIFSLYSFSGYMPNGVDENGKPFYKKCNIMKCKEL